MILRPRVLARRGLTLIESMILLIVLTIVGVGVGIGLQAAVRAPAATEQALAISTELNSELETWRSVAFGSAPWPATLPYSKTDTVSISYEGRSQSFPRTTKITAWDPNNLTANTSPKTDFVQVSVTINGQNLTAYVTSPQ